MKLHILALTLVCLATVASAKSKEKDEKKYTEAELQKAVNEKVDKVILKMKNTSLTQLTKELLEKERVLEEREQKLAEREEVLALSEKTLEEQTKQFLEEKKMILGCIDENTRKESSRVSNLVQMISGMKPANAAAVLSVQESDISVRILERIDPVKASKIFNSMDKEISARLQKQYLNMKQ